MRVRKSLIVSGGVTLGLVALGILIPMSSQAAPAAGSVQADVPWTGTWGTSPQSSSTTVVGNTTLRQIVHTSISGTAARVQLSNVFGSAPVTISDVHIAQRTSGSSINAATDQKVTFGGSASVTIAAGVKVASDSIAFPVKALSDVAISFYLPQPTGTVTEHQLAQQTNYYTPGGGDLAANATLANPQTYSSYTFLADLDVQNTAATGAVVALGASITDGIDSAADANRRWTNDLAVRLNAAGANVGVINQGISGNALLHDGAGPSAANRFSRDVLAQPNVKWVVFADDPINDINNANPPTGAQLIAGVQPMITAAHQAGIKFLCATLTPFKPDNGWTQAGENSRAAYNAFVRSSGSGCDGILDFDTATHDPANIEQFLPAYNNTDHLHPNTDGLQAMADSVNLSLFGAATTNPGSGSTLGVISLKAHANSNYVTAENAGDAALIANRTAIGPWESFDEVDAGNGAVALRAHANNKFVTAGTSPLIANSSTVGTGQTFTLIHNSDGSVSLKATANGDYVTAENTGADPLIANRTAIGPWEGFDLVND